MFASLRQFVALKTDTFTILCQATAAVRCSCPAPLPRESILHPAPSPQHLTPVGTRICRAAMGRSQATMGLTRRFSRPTVTSHPLGELTSNPTSE